MKWLLLILLSPAAVAQSTIPISNTLWITNSSSSEPIVTCSMKDERHVDKCTLADGHTLEEAIQAVIDQNRLTTDSLLAEVESANKRTTRCLNIAERENKALGRCAKGLDDIAHTLSKGTTK